MIHIMGKAPSRPTTGLTSRHTRVLAALALFLVLAMPLAGTWPDQSASAQVIWDFWMESDMDLYGNDQTIRLFGNIGYAIADHPIVIQVFDERNNLVDLDQVQTDSSGGFEATVGPIRNDGSYTVHAKHEFAGSTWTTFTIGQPPEAVLEEAPQEPVPETGDAPPETEDAVPTVEETVQHAPMASEELLLLPVALISLSVIIPLWLLHRFLRSETQAEHEEAMPPGRDGPREPQPETGARLPSVPTRGMGAFPPQEAPRVRAKPQEQLPDHRAVVRSSLKAVGGGFPQKTPQSGYPIGSGLRPTVAEGLSPLQELRTSGIGMSHVTTTVLTVADWKAVRLEKMRTGKTGMAARLKGKFIVFDTNICISYMCGRLAQDMEMSSKARKLFNGPKGGDIDPDIPDCIDIALDEGRICLPTKTATEFYGSIQRFIDDKEIEWADRPKLKKSTLLDILLGGRRKGTHNVTIKGFRSSDLDTVKGMYDGFAADTSPRMVRNMSAMYAKLMRRAKDDETEIARINKMRANKESPLGDGDGKILATALTLSAKLKPLCLITMDSDMSHVAADIKDRIGIEIIGCNKG